MQAGTCTEDDCFCGGSIFKASGRCYRPTSCGGANQRACCIGEGSGRCGSGLTEVNSCSGGLANCVCAGGGVSNSTCLQAAPCGGSGQRACCGGELINGGSCGSGLGEVPGCSGNCLCGGSANPLRVNSSGHCVTPATACGNAGQRACCAGTGEGSACNSGLTEVNGCSGNCLCGGTNPLDLNSNSSCVQASPCGNEGQRACCTGEGAACNTGLAQASGCTGNCLCGGSANPLRVNSSGHCVRQTTGCGNAGQRACCGITGEGAACNSGLTEVNGCTGNCLCGGTNPTDINSNSSCIQVTPCGSEGQRACCTGEGAPCTSGFVSVPGCSGDCVCGGTANPLRISAGDHCVTAVAEPCGGEGQRGCCAVTGENAPCNEGLTERNGCTGNCLCGGTNPLNISSNSHCFRATPCGGAGQRGCCGGELVNAVACGPDLDQYPGCTGDCLCGGSANPLGISSSGHCVARAESGCGNDGQRGCCAITGEGAPCNEGLTEINGCEVACLCGGDNPTSIRSNSTCVETTPCGGKGQRGCCDGERLGPDKCNEGLVQVDGCSGDCRCGGSANPLDISSSGTCTEEETIDEPSTGWDPPTAPPTDPMRGYADIHVHMFAQYAHGGAVLAGEAYDEEGGVNAALATCYGTDLDVVARDGGEVPVPSCPDFPSTGCGSHLLHGGHGLIGDTTGDGTMDGSGSNLGAPVFNGWPRWTSTTHQQVYYKWLERAVRGGLRLMSLLAVTNEALCKSSKHLRTTNCDNSMLPPSELSTLDAFDERFRVKPEFAANPPALPPIERQLQAAYEFETYLDAQSGGAGQGWFRIVRTPAEARQVIAAGKLAVVLGIEVDNPFGCKFSGPCTEQDVAAAVTKYYDKGVRHFFPIHNFDNGFGSPAAWQDVINLGNAVSEGRWWAADNCIEDGYGFWLDSALQGFIDELGFASQQLPNLPSYPTGSGVVASCNTLGLSPLGEFLIGKLMDAGMVIDIDHMSRKSFDRTLELTAARNYPVIASHVQFFDLYTQLFSGNAGRHERMRTLEQLEKIRDGGGMVAAMLKDDVQDTPRKGQNVTIATYGDVTDDCRHSSKPFAQAYKYAVDKMQGPVALGSDFNGVAGHVGPRFGSDACGDDLSEKLIQLRASNRISYPFTLDEFGSFERQKTGQKTFDFNVDGLAHIGLLPDLLADLQAIGLTATDLNPLFTSAAGFVDVWERGLPLQSPTPTATPTAEATATRTPINATVTGSPERTESQTPLEPTLTATTGAATPTGSPVDPTATGSPQDTETPTPLEPTATALETTIPPPCIGDCNGDRVVAINELVIGVNIALGPAAVAQCDAMDGNHDGNVAVNELVAAVNHALTGCPAA